MGCISLLLKAHHGITAFVDCYGYKKYGKINPDSCSWNMDALDSYLILLAPASNFSVDYAATNRGESADEKNIQLENRTL